MLLCYAYTWYNRIVFKNFQWLKGSQRWQFVTENFLSGGYPTLRSPHRYSVLGGRQAAKPNFYVGPFLNNLHILFIMFIDCTSCVQFLRVLFSINSLKVFKVASIDPLQALLRRTIFWRTLMDTLYVLNVSTYYWIYSYQIPFCFQRDLLNETA